MGRCRTGAQSTERGRRDYEDLGELTVQHARYLVEQTSDAARRRVVATWYGPQGGLYAWAEWLRLRDQFTQYCAAQVTAPVSPVSEAGAVVIARRAPTC